MRSTGVGGERRDQPLQRRRTEDRDHGVGTAGDLGGDGFEAGRLDGEDDQIGRVRHLRDRVEPLSAHLVGERLAPGPSPNR